jgi:hypothetical protein
VGFYSTSLEIDKPFPRKLKDRSETNVTHDDRLLVNAELALHQWIYTLIESCRRRGIDPFTYLRDVLTRLPKLTNRQVPDLVPTVWLKSHMSLQRLAS